MPLAQPLWNYDLQRSANDLIARTTEYSFGSRTPETNSTISIKRDYCIRSRRQNGRAQSSAAAMREGTPISDRVPRRN